MSPLPEVLLNVARSPWTAVGLPIGLGMLSGYVAGPGSSVDTLWFKSLKQPAGNPPPQAVPAIWTVLYACMGYASHLTVQAMDSAAASPLTVVRGETALQLYYAQLGFNLLWPPIFFGAKKPKIALANILALTGTAFVMTAKMAELPTVYSTSLFLAPYCAWLGYATYMNAKLVWLNP